MNSPILFGAVADLQYQDADPEMNRYFRKSPFKLMDALNEFNQHHLNFVINLGDTIDKGWGNYDNILPVFDKSNTRVYHILGNHDFEIEDDFKPKVPRRLNTKRYYDFSINHWRFIILDGNEISLYAHPETSEEYKKSKMFLEKLEKEGVVNANFWNGGIDKEQIVWLESLLAKAEKNNENVIIFCHFPIFPEHRHNLLNDRQVLDLISAFDCFKIWINGHNHDGNYGMFRDKHFINLRGIVDGEFDNAFSIFRLLDDHVQITGFGREISAKLTFH